MIDAGRAPGLYVHIPYCAKICPYCDFAVTRGNRDKQRAFVAALLAELELIPDWHGQFDTLYFGGGTPSILAPEELGQVIAAVRGRFDCSEQLRITIEANPEDATAAKLEAWRQLGTAGISFGIQSFSDPELRFLGRQHTPQTAKDAVTAALSAGFEWVSVDLIYGLPKQTLAEWHDSLAVAVSLRPHHISCYQLTIHEGTPFFRREARGQLQQLTDAALGDFFRATHDTLAHAGYRAYEVSNFARSDSDRSPHNQKYWNHTPYLGIGPSAHSFDGRKRWWNERDASSYQQRVGAGQRPIADQEQLNASQLALEAAMLALRTSDGIDCARYQQTHGVDLEALNAALFDELRRSGLLETKAGRLSLTTNGLAVVDGITPRLVLHEQES
ncbi:MAG: radical SAM family heme chaperone HemW [Planctomycetota bacterium]